LKGKGLPLRHGLLASKSHLSGYLSRQTVSPDHSPGREQLRHRHSCEQRRNRYDRERFDHRAPGFGSPPLIAFPD
jgi:hypothetical protein